MVLKMQYEIFDEVLECYIEINEKDATAITSVTWDNGWQYYSNLGLSVQELYAIKVGFKILYEVSPADYAYIIQNIKKTILLTKTFILMI